MVKTCANKDCESDAIHRGRYCEEHRSVVIRRKTKKNDEEERLSEIFIKQLLLDEEEQVKKLSEDRQLKSEQEKDYLQAEKQDRENLRVKEIAIQRNLDIRQKFEEFIPELSDVTFQLSFPQLRLKIKQNFHLSSIFSELFEFVDIILEDHDVSSASSYQVILYPNHIYPKEIYGHSEELMSEMGINHGSSISICIL